MSAAEAVLVWTSPVGSERVRASVRAFHRQHLLARADHRCEWCGSAEALTVDHIVPRSRGGIAHWTNTRILCSRCNESRGAEFGALAWWNAWRPVRRWLKTYGREQA